MKIEDFDFTFEYRDALKNKALELKNKGALQKEIAAYFEKQGYKTVSGGSKWYVNSISRLIND